MLIMIIPRHADDCYLLISRTAEQVQITAAYKRLARLYHPDKHQVNSAS